jgi:hypothetical protein
MISGRWQYMYITRGYRRIFIPRSALERLLNDAITRDAADLSQHGQR